MFRQALFYLCVLRHTPQSSLSRGLGSWAQTPLLSYLMLADFAVTGDRRVRWMFGSSFLHLQLDIRFPLPTHPDTLASPSAKVPFRTAESTGRDLPQMLSCGGPSVTSQKMRPHPSWHPYPSEKRAHCKPTLLSGRGLPEVLDYALGCRVRRTRAFLLNTVQCRGQIFWCPQCLPGQKRLVSPRGMEGSLKSSPFSHLASKSVVWQCREGHGAREPFPDTLLCLTSLWESMSSYCNT